MTVKTSSNSYQLSYSHSLLIPKSKPIFKLSPEETLELETAIRHLSLLFDLLERTAASAESRQQQLQRQRRLQRERLQLQPPGAPRPPSRRSMMDSGATGCFMVKKHLNRRSDVWTFMPFGELLRARLLQLSRMLNACLSALRCFCWRVLNKMSIKLLNDIRKKVLEDF